MLDVLYDNIKIINSIRYPLFTITMPPQNAKRLSDELRRTYSRTKTAPIYYVCSPTVGNKLCMFDPLSANVANQFPQFPILRHKGDYRDEHWFYVLPRYKWKVHDFPHKFVNGGVLSISNPKINREINNNNNNNNNLKKSL